mgnify:CR=1 FL=1
MEERIYLVSYPRSGNTWMRFLLANILYPDEDVNYISINKFVPDIHQHQNWEREGVENPRFVKSHRMLQDDYQQVIYIYRDGRDVALSNFYYYQGEWAAPKWRGGDVFEAYLERFIEGQEPYGDWKAHVNFWLLRNHKIKFLPVKYEDLIENPMVNVRRVATFSELNVKTEILSEAIFKSNYKELQKIQPRDSVHPKLGGLRGAPGGWKEMFTDSQNKAFWDYAGNLMEKLGYEEK